MLFHFVPVTLNLVIIIFGLFLKLFDALQGLLVVLELTVFGVNNLVDVFQSTLKLPTIFLRRCQLFFQSLELALVIIIFSLELAKHTRILLVHFPHFYLHGLLKLLVHVLHTFLLFHHDFLQVLDFSFELVPDFGVFVALVESLLQLRFLLEDDLLHFVGIPLEPQNEVVLVPLDHADLGDTLLRDLGDPFVELAAVVPHLLKFTLEKFDLLFQVRDLAFVGVGLRLLRLLQLIVAHLLIAQFLLEPRYFILLKFNELDCFFFRFFLIVVLIILVV